MRDLHTGRGLAPAAHAVVRRHLEWPAVAHPEQAAQFAAFGTKGGTFPGVLTGASYVQLRGGGPAAAALFLRDLPPRLEAELARTFAQEALLVRLATDPAFRREARARLSGARR